MIPCHRIDRVCRNGWGRSLRVAIVALGVGCGGAVAMEEPTTATGASPGPLVSMLADELAYSMAHLATEDGTQPYYLSYAVYDETRAVVSATLGAVTQDMQTRDRQLSIDIRVGDYTLDNTHQLRGGGPAHVSGSGNIALPLADNETAIKHILWYRTDKEFKRAARRLSQIQTNLKIKVEEEDRSSDFSRDAAHQYYEPPAVLDLDRAAWARRLRKISAVALKHPLIYSSSITIGALAGTRTIVTSEGARLQTTQTRFRITLSAGTKAEDGMELQHSDTFNASTREGLPDDAELTRAFDAVIAQVLALREAPLAEPYIGPAILRNRASAVFFHEIFGHRIEGHRAKDVTEGQTFTKRIGEPVLPTFISVFDDPTRRRLGHVDLRGYYRFDDEGVKARNVCLVDHGVLQTFLMSRRPVDRFPTSNGHGRRAPGKAVVARQANLIVESTNQVSFDELRRLLIEECRRQDKPYGLLFEDISGGFTTTSRRGPQSFKVLPVVVYKVFADGRPDELIRGADIVGTPLTCFEKIIRTADEPDVFNGSCGAESGWLPVSAISPSILVSTIEIEKRRRDQSRPPILSPPIALAP
ncbi:MAG: metallopeptidase TldD-related protein [Phycisphaerae bacterium]